jgi:hypothetical protein
MAAKSPAGGGVLYVDGLDPVGTELAHGVAQVGLDRRRHDLQVGGHFLVRPAARDRGDHLQLRDDQAPTAVHDGARHGRVKTGRTLQPRQRPQGPSKTVLLIPPLPGPRP